MAKRPSSSLRSEPRWPAVFAILTTCILYGALPKSLAVGPRWLAIAVVCIVEIPAILSHRQGYVSVNRILGYVASGLITAFTTWSLALLVFDLPSHKESPIQILRSAGVLWISNVLVFALWYWRLDGGGPAKRESRSQHQGAFLFPQMTWDGAPDNWSPRFIDYLFVSFNTSTAFSPTDAPVLSRWAKALVMLQASISLGIVILLAARAVNIM